MVANAMVALTSERALEEYTLFPRAKAGPLDESLPDDRERLRRLGTPEDGTSESGCEGPPQEQATTPEGTEAEVKRVVLEKITEQVFVRPVFYAACTVIFALGLGALSSLLVISFTTGEFMTSRPTLFMGSLCCLGWLATSIAGIISWKK